ncbi:MAG: multiheme c-type cytochrome [Bryobacteraceae bacterium]
MKRARLFCAFLSFAQIVFAADAFASSRPVSLCSTCHSAQAKPHPTTSMAHALEVVRECGILKNHQVLSFTEGKYSYGIERKGAESSYSVSDGQQTLTVPIAWAFGLGSAGQTYVFKRGGEFYESRVSYFRELDGLDLTLGAADLKPTNILEALGRHMRRDEAMKCFGCHATNTSHGGQFAPDKLIGGVQCERCHGSTQDHLAGLKQGNPILARMKKLNTLSTEEVSKFCGQCHRTWEEIAFSPKRGITNVRFQPYRLTNSKCYDAEDSRISCLACHDPHQELDRDAAHYDAKCQACHGGGKTGSRHCKVSTNDCTSCHMPKLELPGSHHKFSDHEIRIVKANENYPD